MSNEELLKNWMRYLDKVGPEEALSKVAGTKLLSASTAERLCDKRYKAKRPSKRTRRALEAVLGKKAS